MRVIAGAARGRPLQAPRGRDVRPTSDRVREALFSIVASDVPDARVLDLFAGSGALAIEALSRGAAHAVLVERDAAAVAVASANLHRTDLADRATLHRADAAVFCRRPDGGPFSLLLLDPPYAEPLADVYRLLDGLHGAGAVARDATVAIERTRRDPDLDAEPPGFLALDRRRSYGDTVLLVLRTRATKEPGAR